MAAVLAQMQIRPLAPQIGAEIIGVDLSEPLPPEQFAKIRDAWFAHCIVLLRGQKLGEEDQVRFAAGFGELGRVNKHPGVEAWASKHHHSVMFISNIKENGELIGALPDGEMMFHTDQCYTERPSAAAMLYAMEIPSKGGNTLYANMYRAYETLPEDLKQQISGLQAVNVYDYANAATHRGAASKEAPRYAHPIVRTHPATGKKSLYVSRLMSESIVGMAQEEAERLLARLFDHQENPAWAYEHVWKVGDLLIWDNRCTLHARTDFDASERRLLRRCVVLGEKPV
ncbi:MAG: TauD/TfdA family dioxygenase [Betaproteobacteria bacterium]|nr:TauD/TfdA family dioxygenase [Betaproteobacteria bacterium]